MIKPSIGFALLIAACGIWISAYGALVTTAGRKGTTMLLVALLLLYAGLTILMGRWPLADFLLRRLSGK